jgi:hypothetical protein
VTISLLRTLQGSFGQQGGLQHIPYKAVIEQLGGAESLAEMLLNTIDVSVRSMEGRIITSDLYGNSGLVRTSEWIDIHTNTD